MTGLFQKLWADDNGAIISVEWVLIVAILIFGLIPGLVALRNAIDAAMATIGNFLTQMVPNFSFSGFAISGSISGATIASVGGFSNTFVNNDQYTSTLTAPQSLNLLIVDPAP
jgi:Flp pilus assembly pilin Flp